MNAAAWLYPDLTPDEARLARFREAHPDVDVHSISSGGAWQAQWSGHSHAAVVTRYTLDGLLDALDEIFGDEISGADSG